MGKHAHRSKLKGKEAKRPRPQEESEDVDPLLTDARFNSASWDPRFSRVPKRAKRAIADDRFQGKLKNDLGFRDEPTKVDRFGRPKKSPKLHQSLQQLAESDDPHDETSSSDDDANEIMTAPTPAEHASSDDEDESDLSDVDDGEEDVDAEPELIPRGEATHRLAVVGLDWSVTRAVDIFASLSSFCPTGKSIRFVEVHPSKFGLERLAVEAKFGPQVIPAEDLRVVQEAQSAANRDNSQSLHADLLSDDDEDAENEDGDERSDGTEDGEERNDDEPLEEDERKQQAALRRYEEDRLKYYYAVVKFSDVGCADAVYEQCDGVEYAQTGRAFDLRFIPDDMAITTKARDRAESIPDGYAPPTVNLSSLNNSNVKLSWDADDPERVILKKKAFGDHELDEENLKAYLASSSSDEEDEAKQSELEKKRNLLLDIDKKKDDGDDDVDLVVTFDPGMLEKGEEIVKRKMEKDEQKGETEWETRMRRMKERKQEKRRQRREILAAKDNSDAESEEDDGQEEVLDENPSFSDPFFSTERNLEEEEENSKHKGKNKSRGKNRKDKEVEDGEEGGEEKARQRAELELLTMGDGRDVGDSGSLRQRLADEDSDEDERRGRRKQRRSKRERLKEKEEEKKKADVVDVSDERFEKVFESHLFAIDPTHPKYKDDHTTKKMMKEKGRRSRKREVGADDGKQKHESIGSLATGKSGEGTNGDANSELRQLAARVKARAKLKKKSGKKR